MKFGEFIKFVERLPIVETEILLAGRSDFRAVKVQISRWQKQGKIIQLKRGVYLLAEPYRKQDVYEPYIAAILKRPSYISLEKALEYHGLIPEAVAVYTSVTPKRQAKFVTPIGTFSYRHIKNSLFWGYESVIVNNQIAFMALPEKALLDLIYLNGMDISVEYLKELRLQNVEKINMQKLFDFAKKFKKPAILKASKTIKEYIEYYKAEEKIL